METTSSSVEEEEAEVNNQIYAIREPFDSSITLPLQPSLFISTSTRDLNVATTSNIEINPISIEGNYLEINSRMTHSLSRKITTKFDSEGRRILIRRKFSLSNNNNEDDHNLEDYSPPPSPTRKIKYQYGIGNDSDINLSTTERPRSEPIITSEFYPPIYHRSISLPLPTKPINPCFESIPTKQKLFQRPEIPKLLSRSKSGREIRD